MTSLEELIRDRIARQGPLTFRDFMALALYDPRHGYYATASDRIGRRGDFYTASSVSNHFGRLLARQAQAIWQALGQPPDFAIAECGAGAGDLAADLLAELRVIAPDCFRRARYVICETSAAMRAAQAARLSAFAAMVAWSELDALATAPITGLIFSNELIDALPVHLLACRGGRWREGLVTVGNGRLQLVWEAPTRPQDFADYLAKGELALGEGEQCEIALDAADWLAKAAAALGRGYLVTIDYGDTGDHLSGRPAGTLRCFARHRVSEDVFANLGQQDITADANFSALINYGTTYGLRAIQLARQADYLLQLGLLDLLQETVLAGETPEAVKARLALKHFLVPGGFGDRFKVLAQAKGDGLPRDLPRPSPALQAT
ncbi:MAG: SAM-dependent methyltransferase [Chloracidobacterium sp. CP2_5A]|nr:MAG: SAM-dependent methyltransferase [Chloracidobacterium sp. CP2_5A]